MAKSAGDCVNDYCDTDDRQSHNDKVHFEERRHSDSRSRSQAFGVEDLASKILLIQAKKFYVDVKQNKRGRFIKISEVGSSGFKNKLIFEMSAASDFHEMLTNFIEKHGDLGGRSFCAQGDDRIKSEVIFAGERRYYMDLKENSRGRFLKVAMTMPPPSMERQQIVIPAEGMVDIRDVLTEMLSEFGTTEKIEEKVQGQLSLEAENKVFLFDIGENKRGDYLRISEVSPSFRTAINVPQEMWPAFVNKLRSMATVSTKSSETCRDSANDNQTDDSTGQLCTEDSAAMY